MNKQVKRLKRYSATAQWLMDKNQNSKPIKITSDKINRKRLGKKQQQLPIELNV